MSWLWQGSAAWHAVYRNCINSESWLTPTRILTMIFSGSDPYYAVTYLLIRNTEQKKNKEMGSGKSLYCVRWDRIAQCLCVTACDEADTEDTVELARGNLTDFLKSTPFHVLNNIILLVQQSLARFPAAHPSRYSALNTLTDELCARFYPSYDISDLNNGTFTPQAVRSWQQSDMYRIYCILLKGFEFIGNILDIWVYTGLHWVSDVNRIMRQEAYAGQLGSLGKLAHQFRPLNA